MKLFDTTKPENLWNCFGDFGHLHGKFAPDSRTLTNECYTLEQTLSKSSHGVYERQDILRNISDSEITISCLKSRFVLCAGDYEVYTQYNAWCNESIGAWQPLTTAITVGCQSVRSCTGASPFMALWNNQTNRGIVFHLLPESTWEMCVSRTHSQQVLVEMGMDAPNLQLKLAPSQQIKLPQILYYEFMSKTDIDCYKLHRYCNDRFPKRKLPVMYDTWLDKFDKLNLEHTLQQVPLAAELGVEYFVIDAGWFGKNDLWIFNIGDWEESLNLGYQGQMLEVAKAVRANGIKFGLWLEPERAVEEAKTLESHKQFFIHGGDRSYYLNFADEDARNYIFDVTRMLIETYGVEFIKFDFNDDLYFDDSRTALTEYFKGYSLYIRRLRETFPHVYLENCASGGARMHLGNCQDFDSFWPTDNQSAHEGMRIMKDTILRMPPNVLDRWASIESLENTFINDLGEKHNQLITIGDAVWQHLDAVHPSQLKGYLSGGPLGLSCDLTHLSDLHFEMLKKHIAQFKKDRAFWANAECRISVDTPSLFILEYRDRTLDKVVTQVYIRKVTQLGLFLYPQLDPEKTYCINGGKAIKGSTLMEDGHYLEFNDFPNMTMLQTIFTSEE